jgi:hypothetical protein
MRIEEEHTDVMQNLEFAVATTYREHPEMADYAALRVYETLAEIYSAERAARPARPVPMSEIERELLDRVHEVCEWRLGRSPLGGEVGGDGLPPGEPLPLETMIRCLKRLVKSVNTWTRRSGRQGYLNFMTPYSLTAPR